MLLSFDTGRYAGWCRAGIAGGPPESAPAVDGARDGRVVLCKSQGRIPMRYELIVECIDIVMPEKGTQKRVEPQQHRHSQEQCAFFYPGRKVRNMVIVTSAR
jgi:hypothetical protein